MTDEKQPALYVTPPSREDRPRMHWVREYEMMQERERAARTIQPIGCALARGIKREDKRERRHKKAAQHVANLALRRDMNREAHRSEGKRPRPFPGMRA